MTTPFVPAGTPARYLVDRPAAVEHIKLEISLDFANKRISGVASLRLRARQDGLEAVTLNAVNMTLSSATAAGKPVATEGYDGQTLRIPLDPPVRRGDVFEIKVDYSAQPTKGLFFLQPDANDPRRPTQCWTQGQDEDARYVFPCIDTPAEKATTEVICTVPKGKQFLSNGDLLETRDLNKTQTLWHYKLSAPHASYLVTLVCGDFVVLREQATETKVDVYHYAPPDRVADTQRSLASTPRMIDVFSKVIGIPYPHKRYSQVVVSDFVFGGMENTTATTLTDHALVDEEAALDHDVEYLVAHELAHQWWGDLVTCREWSEAWLNEGFATYFEYIWLERDRSRDEADWHALEQLDHYLHEAGDYQRPIVCRQYRAPIEIFDAHLYEKGGRVLHMLRQLVGDETFFAALRAYGNEFAGKTVETRDLVRTFEALSGRSLDRFFDQWVGRPGHPELEVSWSWDDDRQLGVLKVVQTQSEDFVYEFIVPVAFEVNGRLHHERVLINEKHNSRELRLEKKPTMVVFDAGGVLVADTKLNLPAPLLTRQVAAGPAAIDRIVAARALTNTPEAQVVVALAAALNNDVFWGVRAMAARQLAQLAPRQDALQALLKARTASHPKVRREVAAALGAFRAMAPAADALVSWIAAGDASVFALANAARSLGQTRDPRAATVLPPLIGRASFQSVVAVGAVAGLGASGLDEAIAPLIAAYVPTAPSHVRRMCLRALAALAEGTPAARRAREHIEHGLTDRDFTVRYAAAMGLGILNDRKAEPALEAAMRHESDGRAWRIMDRTLRRLREGQTSDEAVGHLKTEMEKLRDQVQILRERLDTLQAPAATPKPSTTPKAPRPRRPRPAARRTPKPRSKPRR